MKGMTQAVLHPMDRHKIAQEERATKKPHTLRTTFESTRFAPATVKMNVRPTHDKMAKQAYLLCIIGKTVN